MPHESLLSKPDPRLAFTTRNGTKALGLLAEGLKKRAGLIVVNGEPGVGKTTLLRKFALHAREGGHAIFLPEQPAGSMEGLLKAVCAEGGIKPSGHDRIAHLYALREHLDMRLKTGEFCAIVADNLDGVPDTMLRDLGLLVDLERSNMRPVQIVLAGTPKLIDRLNTPEFNAVRKEVAAVIKLEPFERDETGAYLQHCLNAAGYRGPDLFSFAAIERIHAKTRGVPRAINQVAVSALAALKASGGKLSSEAIDTAVASALAETVATSVPASATSPAPVISTLPVAPPSEIVIPSSGGLMGQPQTMTVRMMLDKLDREFNTTPAAEDAPAAYGDAPVEYEDAALEPAKAQSAAAPRKPAAAPPEPAPAPREPVAAPAPAPRAETEQVIAQAVQAIAPKPQAAPTAPTPAPTPAPAPVVAVIGEATAPVAEKPTPSAAELVAEALAMVDAEEAQQARHVPASPPVHVAPPPPRVAAATEAKPHNSARQRLLARLTGR